jgi:DNA-binding transcriptional ArsR family regulator
VVGRIHPASYRRAFAMMLVEIMRRMRKDLDLSLDEIQLLLLIAAGTHEGNPWMASKASTYLDEPRQTIDRRVRALVGRGLVRQERQGRSIVLRLSERALLENNPGYNAAFNKWLGHVREFVRQAPEA